MNRFLLNVLVWIDEGLNTLTLGSPDETVSSRAAKSRDKGQLFGCVLCRLLDWIKPGHCTESLQPSAGADAIVKD